MHTRTMHYLPGKAFHFYFFFVAATFYWIDACLVAVKQNTHTAIPPLCAVCAAGGQSTSAKCLDCSSTFPFIHCKYQFNFVLLTVSTLSPLALVVMAVVSDFEFVCVRELVSTLA